MKRVIELVALAGIGFLGYYLWRSYKPHVDASKATTARQEQLNNQVTNWALPWEQPINQFNYLAADVAGALAPLLKSQGTQSG